MKMIREKETTLKMIRKRWFLVSLTLVVCASARPVTGQERNVYWGDTHVHTSYSGDSYSWGNVTADPETAYRFAKGASRGPPGPRESGASRAAARLSSGGGSLSSQERGLPSKGTGTHPSSRRPRGRFMLTRPNETTTRAPSPR